MANDSKCRHCGQDGYDDDYLSRHGHGPLGGYGACLNKLKHDLSGERYDRERERKALEARLEYQIDFEQYKSIAEAAKRFIYHGCGHEEYQELMFLVMQFETFCQLRRLEESLKEKGKELADGFKKEDSS